MRTLDVSISLFLALLQSLASHYSSVSIEPLVTHEPQELSQRQCSGSAEVLVGNPSGQEYISVICQQPTRSFLVLQQLLGYTDNRKAVLKPVDIRPLPPMQNGEFSTNRGCTTTEPSPGISAIVRDIGQPIYQTIKAWKVNLQAEMFEEIDPQVVVCKRSWL